MSHENVSRRAILLNAKTGKYQTGVDNNKNPLTPEDIAYGIAHLKKVTKNDLGSHWFRVRHAHQIEPIEKLIEETAKFIGSLGYMIDSAAHRPMAELALRELGAIRPERSIGYWKGSDAEKHTDKKKECRCPRCETVCHRTPGKFVTCYNPSCSGRKRGKPVTFQFMILSTKERRRWVNVANRCSRYGMDDGQAIKMANDVVAGRQEFSDHDIPLKWEAAPEMCPSCSGARERNRSNRIINCPTCENGHRRWPEDTRRQYVFANSGNGGRKVWRNWLSTLYQREIKGTLIQMNHDILYAVKYRIR